MCVRTNSQEGGCSGGKGLRCLVLALPLVASPLQGSTVRQ